MKFSQILFLSGMIIMSCKPKSATEESSATLKKGDITAYETEILKIHDEAMPKMTEMNQLETQLRNIRTKASQSDQGSSAIPEGIDQVIQSLKSAQNGMLDWMEYYSAMRSKLQQDVMFSFMESELQKIKVVKDSMSNSIDKAKAWLAAHPSL